MCLDPLLHRWRLRHSFLRVHDLLPRRPLLRALQPPAASIYISHTQIAARRLHWSLVSIRINRSLSRRPKLATLVSANIMPAECCAGVAGLIIERKRQLEREQLKGGLRVWLERKAREIRARKKEGGVKVLAWRFSRRELKARQTMYNNTVGSPLERPRRDNVAELRRYFERLGTERMTSSI